VSVAENPQSLVPLGSWAGQQLDAAREELHRDAEETVQLALDALDGCGSQIEAEVIDLCKEGGDVTHAIAEAALRYPAGMVVLGTRHHRGLMRWLEGEVSAPFARVLRRPVLIVPAGYEADAAEIPSRILFATDGSEVSLAALRIATTLATPHAHWRAVYVVDRLLAPGTGIFEKRLEDALSETGSIAVASSLRAVRKVGTSKQQCSRPTIHLTTYRTRSIAKPGAGTRNYSCLARTGGVA